MFLPFQTFSVGPFSLSVEMLSILMGAAFGYAMIHYYLKRKKAPEREKFLDALLMAFIIGVASYKLWPFILQPSLLLDPRNLLYFMGGPYATYMAIGLALVYLIYQAIRNKWSYMYWDSLSIGVVVFFLFKSLFVKEYGTLSPFTVGYRQGDEVFHPVNLYNAWFYFVLLFSILLVPIGRKYERTVLLLTGIFVIPFLLAPFSN